MKRPLSNIALLLAALFCLAGCGKGTENVTAVGTTKADVTPMEVGSITVRPPTRSANSQYEASYYRSHSTLLELWESADAVAWVSVGNWLSETDYGSYYDAIVVKCYKGSLPSSIVLEQAGSSVKTYTDFPLFTYGNEFLVFLQNWDADALSAAGPYGGVDDLPIFKPGDPVVEYPEVTPDDGPDYITEEDQVMPIPEVDDETDCFWSGGPIYTVSSEFTDIIVDDPPIVIESESEPDPEPEPELTPEPEPPYENCYQIIEGGALMDCATGIDGNVYLLDRYFLVDPYLGFTAPTHRPNEEITADLLQVLSRRDSYSHRLFGEQILYRLTDLLEYLENSPPKVEE